ncbi:MAG: hypothetical protein P8168_15505 [Deltaproteobacteria bacterium]
MTLLRHLLWGGTRGRLKPETQAGAYEVIRKIWSFRSLGVTAREICHFVSLYLPTETLGLICSLGF